MEGQLCGGGGAWRDSCAEGGRGQGEGRRGCMEEGGSRGTVDDGHTRTGMPVLEACTPKSVR